MSPDASGNVAGGPNLSLNGSAPRCEHLDMIRQVAAQPGGCRECQIIGGCWVGLRVCLTCGWVACSDDSAHRHALAHYRETDHPLVSMLPPGSAGRWCYVHERAV
jgi:uncharacterized UBP type Zn finger protein